MRFTSGGAYGQVRRPTGIGRTIAAPGEPGRRRRVPERTLPSGLRRAGVVTAALAVPLAAVAAPVASATTYHPVTATIGAAALPLRVAVNPTTGTVFVTNQNDHRVAVVNGNHVTSCIHVQDQPYAVAVDPATNTVYVANLASNRVSVIDGATDQVDVTVPFGPKPPRCGGRPCHPGCLGHQR
jgi:YVTN family beta-propeller protein